MLLAALALRIMRRPPDFVIGGHDRPYMHRWWVIPRNRWFNIYLHKIIRSDDDRALHDHPWRNCSILLQGSYVEISPATLPYAFGDPTVVKVRRAGSVVMRRAVQPHRLEIVDGPVISLFFTGRNVRDWGFYANHGWVHWKEFTDPDDPGLYRPHGETQ